MIRKRKRKDKTIAYQASVKAGGSRHTETFSTKAEAERWINDMRYQRDHKLEMFQGPVRIQRMFEDFQEHGQLVGRAASSRKANEHRYSKYVLPFYDGADMATLPIKIHQGFLQALKRKGLAPATINRYRSLLQAMYTQAIKKQWYGEKITFNPFMAIEMHREGERKIVYWNREEKERFLDQNQDSPYFAFFLTLLLTGIRIGEAVAISADQLDRTSNILSIDRQYIEVIKSIESGTKSRGKIRHIGIVPELREVLYPLADKPDLLFQASKGFQLKPNYVRNYVLPQACEQAGVKTLTPHGLRHTFSAHYLMDGGNMWDLSRILGHSDIKVTQNYYEHFDMEHVQRRMRVVARHGNVIQAQFSAGGDTGGDMKKANQ